VAEQGSAREFGRCDAVGKIGTGWGLLISHGLPPAALASIKPPIRSVRCRIDRKVPLIVDALPSFHNRK
jgi:hypothetical protein